MKLNITKPKSVAMQIRQTVPARAKLNKIARLEKSKPATVASALLDKAMDNYLNL